MLRRTAFTLVELLVVVAIIAVLVAMLIPALEKAREQAIDVRCASTMRQCLMAIALYNTTYEGGLQNYDPTCPFWGQPWPNYAVVPFATEPHYNYAGGTHVWTEHRSAKCFWRGYLLDAQFARPTMLGCSAYDFRGEPFVSSYNGPGGQSPSNWVETNPAQDSFKQNPAFVWYGPGSSNASGDNVAVYVGGNLTWGARPFPHYTKHKARGPLITCPQVRQHLFSFPGGVAHVPFSIPHRWKFGTNVAASLTTCRFAGNIGFTDQSVGYYERPNGGTHYPN